MNSGSARKVERRCAGLGVALSMALALLALSFARLAGDTNSAAFSNIVLDSVLAVPIWSTRLGANLALFALALICVHVLLGVGCWCLARISGYALAGARLSPHKWAVVWSLATAAWLLVTNAALFPHSSLGEPYAELVRSSWHGVDAYGVSSGLFVGAAIGVSALALGRWIRAHWRRTIVVGVSGVAALAMTAFVVAVRSDDAGRAHDQPNIIVVGIDSLRYDTLGLDGSGPIAPHIERFLSKAVVFSDTTTPLARTFPAWVAILTGRHPHTTGAVINLIPRDRIETRGTLADMLRSSGYRTVHAIDEVRFSNLDPSYGFDELITPPIGASDFLIGWFGDTPLSNLIVNTRVGAILFPHLHANRAAAVTYDPDAYIAQLDRRLNFDQPTFLAVHLALAHWPYYWATSPASTKPSESGPEKYHTTVHRVDQQFSRLMELLERKGALRKALVVVLSDHGEGLGGPEDSLLTRSVIVDEKRVQSRGHGTSVLSPHQYQVVLGMRTFGELPFEIPGPRMIPSPVSLEDVTPTVVDLLQLDEHAEFDGRSLLPLIHAEPGAVESFRTRIRFTETEFNPSRFKATAEISTSSIAEAATFYRIDGKSDRVEVRPEKLTEVLENRQYAAMSEGRLLAAIPRASEVGYDLISAWRDGSGAEPLAGPPTAESDEELQVLWAALQERFGITGSASSGGVEE